MPLPESGKPLCICQICECGRHKCPHSPAKPQWDKDCLLTEYKNVYTGKMAEKTLPIKPAVGFNPDSSPFAKDTTTRLAYVPHAVKPPAQREKQVWIPSTVPLESSTTVRDHFVKHTPVPTKSKKPDMSLHRNPGKMSDQTSHRVDFTPKRAEKQVPASDYSSLTCAAGPFDSSTTNRADYTGHMTRPRTSYTPHREYKGPTVPMEGLTNHKLDYSAWELPKKSVRKQAQYLPTNGMTGVSTFMTDFTPKNTRRPSPCLPAPSANAGGEFYSSTTFRDNYRAWPVCPPLNRERASYNPPDAPLESQTCYRDDFVAKSARPVSAKPRLDYRRPSGVMASTTTHKETYQPWSVGPVAVAHENYARATPPPFEGLSTYKDHFIQSRGAPASLLAPANTYQKSGIPLDGLTTYNRDFIKKQTGRCPVPGLPQTPDVVKSGHKFYVGGERLKTAPVVEPVTA